MRSLHSRTHFVEPVLLLADENLREGTGRAYELKLDGYRVLAIKTGGRIRLRSRNDKDFNRKYPGIARALAALPDETAIDGEVVALDPTGTGLVQFAPERLGRRVDHLLLVRRDDPRRPERDGGVAALAGLIAAVRAQGLEGLVAKRGDSV